MIFKNTEQRAVVLMLLEVWKETWYLKFNILILVYDTTALYCLFVTLMPSHQYGKRKI
jgi:hypothetical protein